MPSKKKSLPPPPPSHALSFAEITCHCTSITQLFHLGQRPPAPAPVLPVYIYTDALSRRISGQLMNMYALLPHVYKVDTPDTLLGRYTTKTKRKEKKIWRDDVGGSNRERQWKRHQERKLQCEYDEDGKEKRRQRASKYNKETGQLELAIRQDEEKVEEEEVIEEEEEETYFFCLKCGAHIYLHATKPGYNVWSIAAGLLNDTSLLQRATSAAFPSFSDTISTALSEISQNIHDEGQDVLQASCACSSVRFYITRPTPDNYDDVSSPYPDLIKPYHSHPSSNATDEKWWVCHGNKYLAGTCTCTTCRLVSGFPVQFWTFIPRKNIFLENNTTKPIPEDLKFGTLIAYNSRPDVQRLFCGVCGCTVFYRNTERPELVDVSVGVLQDYGGWLSWWKDRVSFSEMAVDEELRGIVEEGIKGW